MILLFFLSSNHRPCDLPLLTSVGAATTFLDSQLYRDCLRLVDHIASKSPKGQQLRLILRTEFKKNVGETDPAKIEQLKGNAIRGLSNYLVHESGSNDPQLKKRMDAVKTHALSDLQQYGQGGTPR